MLKDLLGGLIKKGADEITKGVDFGKIAQEKMIDLMLKEKLTKEQYDNTPPHIMEQIKAGNMEEAAKLIDEYVKECSPEQAE